MAVKLSLKIHNLRLQIAATLVNLRYLYSLSKFSSLISF